LSITQTLTHSVKSDSNGVQLSASGVEVGAQEIVIDQAFAASTTDALLSIAVTVANIQAIYLLASSDLKIETNNGTSPANTINLKAGRPLVWEKSPGYFSNPLTTNVTAFYITCTAAARLRIRILTS
jgi:hypothetical protein